MPDITTIRAAVTAEEARRRPFWIGGVPTPGDRRAIQRIVAHRLKITAAEVAAVQGETEPK